MAIESLSKALYTLHTKLAEALNRLVSYFLNRKVEVMRDVDIQTPRGGPASPVSDTTINSRKSQKRTEISPKVPRPVVEQDQRERPLLDGYSPGGEGFQKAMTQAKIPDSSVMDNDTLAEPLDISPNPMITDHLKQQDKQYDELSNATRSAAKSKLSTKQKRNELIPHDKTLSPQLASLDWLHANQKTVRVALESQLPTMAEQSSRTRNQYKGNSRHLVETAHAYCANGDLQGFMNYVRNLSDNLITPFSAEIMAEIEIRLFQTDLIEMLKIQKQNNPEQSDNYQSLINATQAGDWNTLATTMRFNKALTIPTICFRRLEKVIPGFEAKEMPEVAPPSFSVTLQPALYRPPEEQFAALENNALAPVTLQDIAAKVVQPGASALGADGKTAFEKLKLSLESEDFNSVAESICYLIDDQNYSVVDKYTYKAIRYRELKERLQDELYRLAATEPSYEIKAALNASIEHIKSDRLRHLSQLDSDFHKKYGKSVFSPYFLDQIKSYNRLAIQ
ncbi:hypothetical protein [Endozoicomonas arenosclerae]|uniref:hypothetical protein n=1 Tax=Endozoicomonas arenosclerae TaxID=1633495 RepID=UPI00155FD0F5|nr:hypothetical protein [Endozoicomonas arenosclerae]